MTQTQEVIAQSTETGDERRNSFITVRKQLAFNDWPQGKQWVLFPQDYQFAEGNIEVEGKNNALFPAGPVINVSLYISQLKINK